MHISVISKARCIIKHPLHKDTEWKKGRKGSGQSFTKVSAFSPALTKFIPWQRVLEKNGVSKYETSFKYSPNLWTFVAQRLPELETLCCAISVDCSPLTCSCKLLALTESFNRKFCGLNCKRKTSFCLKC